MNVLDALQLFCLALGVACFATYLVMMARIARKLKRGDYGDG